MIQLELDLPDRPGELGKVLETLDAEDVNIDAMSANSGGGRTYISLIVNRPIQARQSLAKAGYKVMQHTVITVQLADRPGAFAALARKLGDAGVDIESVVPLEDVGNHVQLALRVDNLDRARAVV